MTCTKCGHPERRTDARFCARCGTKLSHTPVNVRQIAYSPASEGYHLQLANGVNAFLPDMAAREQILSSRLQSLDRMAIANMHDARANQMQQMQQIQYPDQTLGRVDYDAIMNQTAQNLAAREWPSRPAPAPARTWNDWLREILGWG